MSDEKLGSLNFNLAVEHGDLLFWALNIFCTNSLKPFIIQSWCKQPLENIVWKEENADNQHFFPFPAMFSTLSKIKVINYTTFENLMSSTTSSNLNFSKILLFGIELTLPIDPEVFDSFPNKPWFLSVCSASLLKTLREKEKLLETSNFSFSYSVFYLSPSSNTKLSSANSFSLEESKICRLVTSIFLFSQNVFKDNFNHLGHI